MCLLDKNVALPTGNVSPLIALTFAPFKSSALAFAQGLTGYDIPLTAFLLAFLSQVPLHLHDDHWAMIVH